MRRGIVGKERWGNMDGKKKEEVRGKRGREIEF